MAHLQFAAIRPAGYFIAASFVVLALCSCITPQQDSSRRVDSGRVAGSVANGVLSFKGIPYAAEDCLYLNVWRPAQASRTALPVIVWIHGGGFVTGGSSPAIYSGEPFARDGLAFVSFNYRLGRFGFFGFPALDAEHREEAKVTVFGESAGSGSRPQLRGSRHQFNVAQSVDPQTGC